MRDSFRPIQSRARGIRAARQAQAARDSTSRPSLPLSQYAGGYADAWYGDIDIVQENGGLVALETGTVTAYALVSLQQRGEYIVKPGDEVYAGQVVGKHIRDEELVVNICRAKQLTNFREKPSATSDMLNVARDLTLDDAIQYLGNDDLLEVTPVSLRIRKKMLNHDLRARARRAQK